MKFFLWLGLAVLLTACSGADQQTRRFHAFGTVVEISLHNVSQDKAVLIFDEIDDQLQSMHERWHAWQKGELSAIHQACQSGAKIILSEDVAFLIREGARLEQQSLGYFNPAIGELIALWGFLSHTSTQERQAPDPQAILEQLSYQPTMQDLILDDKVVTCQNPHLRLDFGAYAKGYGVQKIMDYLTQAGIEEAIINAGGDVMISLPPGGSSKKVGIASPWGHGPEKVLTISESTSIFTSGVYARKFTDPGSQKTYHHLINPKTGYPSESFVSVTVMHSDPMTADAAATALLASDKSSWSAIVKSMGIEKYLLITQEGERIGSL